MIAQMKYRRSTAMAAMSIATMAFALLAALALPVAAQRQRVSPHEKVEGTIGGKTITIEYGRPSLKGREMMGNLIPFGKVWRLGADEATKLTTPVDLKIGTLTVPAGSYSLFMLVSEDGATQLIVNKVAEQWGAFKYDAAQDLGRVQIIGSRDNPMTEMLTIKIETNGAKSGRIHFLWGDGAATADVQVI